MQRHGRMKRRQAHYGLYGQVAIERAYCESCGTWAFVIDGRFKCCDERYLDESVTKTRRISDVALVRSGPTARYRKRQLSEQHYCCFYCDRRFGSTLWRRQKQIVLRVNWDHINPWVYSLDNKDINFVAACQICNGLKSSHVFGSLDEVRTFLHERIIEKGYSDVRPVQVRICRETPVAKIL